MKKNRYSEEQACAALCGTSPDPTREKAQN
jgi:hypothetical protein